MRATLEFLLPDDAEDLRDALNAGRIRGALWEIGQYLRNREKYAELDGDALEEVTKAREAFYEAVDGLELDV